MQWLLTEGGLIHGHLCLKHNGKWTGLVWFGDRARWIYGPTGANLNRAKGVAETEFRILKQQEGEKQ
jgi:hypothetical protein